MIYLKAFHVTKTFGDGKILKNSKFYCCLLSPFSQHLVTRLSIFFLLTVSPLTQTLRSQEERK